MAGMSSGRPDTRGTSQSLAQLLEAAKAQVPEAMERLLRFAAAPAEATDPRPGTEHLVFTCADEACAIPLTALREVLATLPRTSPLPQTPAWVLGIFPMRSEILALVDPAPLLRGNAQAEDEDISALSRPTTALLVGADEHTLAWAVTAVGAIALVRDEEIHPADASVSHLPLRYVKGVYTPAGQTESYILLDATQIQTDLLAAMTESERTHD